MDQLPPEIVATIFSKVTLKTLTQCRRVCKSWLAVLSDRAILRSHIKLPKCLLLHINSKDTCSSTNSRFLYLYDHRDIPSPHNAVLKLASEASLGTNTELLGYCNGLLCWCLRDCITYTGTFSITNPLTGECMTIPMTTKVCGIGFGYAPSKKQYKLLQFVSNKLRDKVEAKVQILGSGIWTYAKCPYQVGSYNGVYANGALHWIGKDGKMFFFDLETEKFGMLPSPPTARNHPLRDMIVIEGLITVSYEVSDHLRTWIMMEYGVESSWLEFDKHLGRSSWDPNLKYEVPLIFYPEEKSLTLCANTHQLYVYDHKHINNSVIAMPFRKIGKAIPGFVPTFIPMESLFKGS